MKERFLKKSLEIIKNKDSSIDEEKLEEIAYGLEGLYLTCTKMLVILAVGFVLGIVKDILLLMIFYNIIRTTAFGMHAKKSIHCLIISSLFFIGGALLCKYVVIAPYVKISVAVVSLLLLIKYAPADTHKRPLINAKRRKIYKFLSVISGTVYLILIILFRDLSITNYICVGLLEAILMIHPLVYRMFQLPYSNYKNYVAT